MEGEIEQKESQVAFDVCLLFLNSLTDFRKYLKLITQAKNS